MQLSIPISPPQHHTTPHCRVFSNHPQLPSPFHHRFDSPSCQIPLLVDISWSPVLVLPPPFSQISINSSNMASATENMSAAEKLQLEHAQAAEGHHVTVEEVPDEDLKLHHASAGPTDSSTMSDKAAGKQREASAAPSPAKASKLDIQSQELFPELGGPKSQATKNVPKWGAANVNILSDKTTTNGNGPAATAANGAATPSSGTATPKKSTPSGVPLVRLPGRYTETLNLEPQELKPREQLRRPLAQILQDINRTSRAQVKSVPAARGQRFEVVGPQESAQQALKELVKQIGSTVGHIRSLAFCESLPLLTHAIQQQTIHVPIPQSARAHIIGRQGATIKSLQEKTGAKIDVPKDDKNSVLAGAGDDLDDDAYINVKIEGDSISAAAARQQIENIVGERSAKVNTRVKDVPAEFYPFIANGNLAQGSSAQMRIPPHATWSSQVTTPVPASGQRPEFQAAQDHHIQLEGDRQAVLALRQAIDRQVAELRRELLLEQLEIQRGRHQFIIGHSGLSPEDFFEQTGCAIILPTDEDDDAITVVGPPDRIEAAIQKAEELAQSMSLNNVDHLKWTRKQAPNNAAIHSRNVTRYLRQRNEIKRLEKQYRARINTPVSGDGALPWELYLPQGQSFTAASSDIRNLFESHPPSRMSTVDVDPFFHPYMQNEVSRQVREQYGVQLVVPTVTESGAPVLLVYEAPGPAGTSYDIPRTAPSQADVKAFAEGLRAAEKHIADLMNQQDSVTTITTDVPVKFHEKLRRFIKKEQDKQISAGQPRIRVSNLGTTITLRGPQKATQSLAEKIEAFVEQEKADEKERDFTLEFDFPQQYANHLIGKQGSRIRDLRDKFDVEIQVENGKVQLKGPKAKAAAAQRHIESLGKDLADESTVRLIVDPKHHGELIGQKGSTITRLQNKHNVMIFFPRADKNGQEEGAAASGEAGKPHRQQAPNEVVIRGPSKGASAAYDELKGLADYMSSTSHTAIVKVQRKQLPSIIGANGSAVDQLRDQTNTVIELPAKDSTEDPAEIKIKGTKDAVQKAKKILEEKKAVFDDTVSKTIDVERKYHRTLIGAGGKHNHKVKEEHVSYANMNRLQPA